MYWAFVGHIDVIFYTGQSAQLAFDNNAALVGIVYDPAGQLDVFFKRKVRTVDHNGGKSAIDAGFADFKGVAMVKMHCDGQIGIFDSASMSFIR